MPRPSPVLYSSTQRFRPVLKALREAGVDVARVLATSGFTEAQLIDPATRVPRERVVQLTGQLLWATKRPGLGVLAAEAFVLPDLGVVGYLMRHAAHPLEALHSLARYQRLIADAADLQVSRGDGQVTIRAALVGGRPTVAPAVDFTVGCIVQAVAELSGGRTRPLAVALPRPRPQELAPYVRHFGRGVRFDGPVALLSYDLDALQVPCVHADAQLAGILARHAKHLLAALPEPTSFVELVRVAVEQQIEQGEFSMRQLADSLGMSERTVRRKLAQQGSSFRDVLDRARCDHAMISLNEGKLSITEIAYRVGFADATAFTRSFRRWTGKTPAEIVRVRSAIHGKPRIEAC